MSKAVMLSIHPKYCELIASGKKTIEVRKTAPKLKPPFKCYIYCTKPDKRHQTICGCFVLNDDELYRHPNKGIKYGNSIELMACDENYSKDNFLNGKVIGDFVCDSIEEIACHKQFNGVGLDYSYYTDTQDSLTAGTQLTDYDIQLYLGRAEDGECVGYGWHISNLKIYDKPKELGEFRRVKAIRGYHKKTEPKTDGINIERLLHSKRVHIEYLTRPPQSWGYIDNENLI